MNRSLCLQYRIRHLKIFRRLFYASKSCNAPPFDEEKIRAKLRPLTGQGGDVFVNYALNNVPGLAVVTIANHARKNALTGHMMVQLAEIVDELETWKSGKAVILHGENGTFASGADISVVKTILTPEEGAQMCFFMQRTLTRLRRLRLVSLAVVQGNAIGGGAELITACDFRIMSQDAEIRFVHAKMGISPGWGGGARLVKLVGRQKALEILLQCKKMNLTESLECGLVNDELLEGKDVLQTAGDWLAPYMECDTTAVKAIKGVVAAGDDLPMDEALSIERSIFTSVWGSEANRDAFSQNIKHS